MKPVRILLADDHAIMRSGLRAVIERQPGWTVVGEAADGRQAVRLVEENAADIIVMDIAMPALNGIDAAQQIARSSPRTAVIMLSMHSDESYVLRALRAGARAYLLKDSAEADLVRAVQAVISGKSFFSPKVSALLQQDHVARLRDTGVTDSYDLLTIREREILTLIAEGKSNKEIATALSLSLYTVETHRGNILEKLDLHGTADVILYAVRKGLVQ